jgi:hypothetical protein
MMYAYRSFQMIQRSRVQLEARIELRQPPSVRCLPASSHARLLVRQILKYNVQAEIGQARALNAGLSAWVRRLLEARGLGCGATMETDLDRSLMNATILTVHDNDWISARRSLKGPNIMSLAG